MYIYIDRSLFFKTLLSIYIKKHIYTFEWDYGIVCILYEIKDTGRGLGEYTYKLRHIRENPIYHVQSMPGFKPGIHTIDDPANAHVSKDVMRTYPAETMPIHHLKPTAGMLAWTQ